LIELKKIPLESKNQTQVSFPTNFVDKAAIIELTCDFSALSNKLAPLVKGILKLPEFQT
jgi:hypothetical protein